MHRSFYVFCFACILIIAQTTAAETILQDFTSKKSFDSFWDISTWGNEVQQYSAANVKLDTVNGWVQLKLNASPPGTKPLCAEITSKRTNFLYGSYRASIKFDSTPGAVVGWFVYKDEPDLHEIDVEYLTDDIKHVHFTLHHIQTDVDYRKDAIRFDPTADFHEYRFDWYSNKVVYFIDGKSFDSLNVKVPDAACTIMLNLWSANIDEWGGPAPTKDTYMYIDYMHYYSDYSTRSLLPPNHQNKIQSDFRIVGNDFGKKTAFLQNGLQNTVLFRFNGQKVTMNGIAEGLQVPTPGVYLSNMKRNGTSAVEHSDH
jgi:beta-glucanase (GH16 family)